MLIHEKSINLTYDFRHKIQKITLLPIRLIKLVPFPSVYVFILPLLTLKSELHTKNV